MEKLTKKEAVRLHREMWKIISEMTDPQFFRYYSPTKVKEYALRKKGYKEENFPKEWCFCCEYTNNAGSIASGITNRRLCSSCPIIWNAKHCFDYYGEYIHFRLAIETSDFDWARRIADRISKLPEREDDNYDII